MEWKQLEAIPAIWDTVYLAKNGIISFSFFFSNWNRSLIEINISTSLTHWIQEVVKLPNIALKLNVKKHNTDAYNLSGMTKSPSNRLISIWKTKWKLLASTLYCTTFYAQTPTWLDIREQAQCDKEYEENVKQLWECFLENGPIWWTTWWSTQFSCFFHFFLVHQFMISIESL